MESKLINNFTDCLEIDYQLEYSCPSNGCLEDGVCRCGVAKDISIKKININLITKNIYEQIFDGNWKQTKRNNFITEMFYGGKEVDLYCINRILSINKVWHFKSWELKVVKGYYSQTVEVSIEENLFKKIENEIFTICEMNKLSERINFLLNLEYGFIPENLKESKFKIIKISKSQIDWSKINSKHLENIIKNNYYDDYNLIRGVVKKVGKKFIIIDGYNRITSAMFPRMFKVFIAY